jgi:PKD repeat protein
MNYFLTLLLTCFSGIALYAQQYNEMRYRERIFTNVTVQQNVQYGSAPQWVWPYWNEDLFLDVYQPAGDVIANRPLIIVAHAGGFLNGAKDVSDMVALCDSFARLGYVTASIAYRKGFNPLDGESAERAVYRGVQDGKAAVRFFKQNASTYGIDTNFVYFGGMSAGGYIALHVAYMDLESERPPSSFGGGTVNNLGCLDCAGNTFPHSSKVRAILDYWGAVQDTTIISQGNTPLMIMHGENDPTVPFTYGNPFGLATLPPTYGGWPIAERAADMGLDYEFYTSEGPLHMLDGSNNGTFDASNPPNSFWYDTLLPRTRAFLYRMTKPTTVHVSDDSLAVCFGQSLTFEVDGGSTSYYKWIYDTNVVSNVVNNHSESLSLTLNQAGGFMLAVVEFNEVYCAGDTLWFYVDQQSDVVAAFSASISNAADVAFTNTSTNGLTQTWDFGDGTTSTLTNPQHTYAQNGTYTVRLIVENAFGCADTLIQTVNIISLGLDTQETPTAFVLYPNPNDGKQVFISAATHSTENLNVVIYNIENKLVVDKVIQAKDLNQGISLPNLSAGVYIFVLSNSNEHSQYRVVIE